MENEKRRLTQYTYNSHSEINILKELWILENSLTFYFHSIVYYKETDSKFKWSNLSLPKLHWTKLNFIVK